MHKTLTKVKNKRLADLIENIIKKMNKSEILECVQSESSLLAKQFKDPDLVEALNNDMLEFLSMPVLAGKDKGEVSGAVIKVDGAYKAFKTKIKKGMKLVKPMDAKSLDALTTLVSGQEKLLERLLMESDNSEVRMNLRNIDANLLRALEELPLNYRETTGDLREDLGRILEAIKISDQSQDMKDTPIRSRKD